MHKLLKKTATKVESKPANPPHLRKRRKTYFAQIGIPKDLQKFYGGRRVIERSLETDSESVAIIKRDGFLAQCRAEFQARRSAADLADNSALGQQVRAESMRRTYQWLMAHPTTGVEAMDATLEQSAEDGPDERLATRALAALNVVVPQEVPSEIVHAAEQGQADAYELFKRGLPLPQAEPATKPLSETIEAYFTAANRDENNRRWGADTDGQYRATARLFQDFAGKDKPIGKIKLTDGVEFIETIAKLQKHWGKSDKAKKLTLQELLVAYPGTLSNVTLNRHKRTLHGFFDWAKKRHLYFGENPFAFEDYHTTDNPYLPFTMEHVNKLLEKPDSKPGAHNWASSRPWITLIGLYSGLRQNEITSLDVENIVHPDGVAMFDVVESKSEAGVRRVPVHSVLLQYGFADYVKHIGSGPLFPGLTVGGRKKRRGYKVSNWFADFRRRQGVADAPPPPATNLLVFHSLRKNVVGEFQRQRIPLSQYYEIVGHEPGFTQRHYAPLGLAPDHSRDLIEKLEFPGIKLPS